MKLFFYSLLITVAMVFVGSCGGAESSNSSGELPEGINKQPASNNSNEIPGIPANGNGISEGTTPTPGIPSNANFGRPLPKGATPTPGIPDEETLRRQMERTDIDANVVNRPATTPPANVKRKDPMGRPRRSNSN